MEGIKQEERHAEQINKTIEQQFLKHLDNRKLEFSTRKIAGTGRYSSLKTFAEMFNENNVIQGVDLSLLPDVLTKDIVFVFNIEHPENRVISNDVKNCNTLCAIYKFKSAELSQLQYNGILSYISFINLLSDTDEVRNSFKLLYGDAIKALSDNMVKSYDLQEINKELIGFNVHLTLPTIASDVDNINSMQDTIEFTQTLPKDVQGFIVYSADGARTKITNKKYKEMKILKGNKPIVIEQWNTKNLFYLYWRLVKIQMIPQFIAEFDTTGGWSYNQLFYWFATLAHGYSVNLYRVYHNAFVKKTIDKYNIPYSMKPLCGDLHTMYKTNKTPISQSMVEQYIFTQSAGKIFWRLFSNS